MGAAAYRRGSEVIAKQISQDFQRKPDAFEVMDRINAKPKRRVNGVVPAAPMDEMIIEFFNGAWWLMHPHEPYERHALAYASLDDAVTSWDFYLVGYDEIRNRWTVKVIH